LIRNRGTIGGSICHCDPAADYLPTLLVLEAEMGVVSIAGARRNVSAKEFIRGTFETALERGELLEKIRLPIPSPDGDSVKKLTLGHGDFPLLSVSVALDFDRTSERFRNAKIALGGVSDKAFRLEEGERLLLRTPSPTAQDFDEVAKIAQVSSDPQADIDVSASYKKRMVRVFTKRALLEAFERAQ
jgi:aerobic carbon-monoxide dehydrogenase medium subunit